MTEGVTVTGSSLVDVRARLGMHSPARIGVSPSGDTMYPKFKVFMEDEVRVVDTPEQAGKLLVAYLKKRFKPEKRGGKKRKLRPGIERRKRNGFRTPERRGR